MFLLSAPKKRLNLNVLNYQLETMLIGVGDRTENEDEGSIWTMSTTRRMSVARENISV